MNNDKKKSPDVGQQSDKQHGGNPQEQQRQQQSRKPNLDTNPAVDRGRRDQSSPEQESNPNMPKE